MFMGATCELGFESVETLVPEEPEARGPVLDLVERGGIEGIEPPGSLRPNAGKTALSQHPEVLRHRRLADREFLADEGGDQTSRLLAARQVLEDPSSHWITQNIKCCHALIIKF